MSNVKRFCSPTIEHIYGAFVSYNDYKLVEDYKRRLEWCLKENPKNNQPNGLPILIETVSRRFWYHPNNVTKEFKTAEQAIDAAMDRDKELNK